jgi:ankyrin repeat protein
MRTAGRKGQTEELHELDVMLEKVSPPSRSNSAASSIRSHSDEDTWDDKHAKRMDNGIVTAGFAKNVINRTTPGERDIGALLHVDGVLADVEGIEGDVLDEDEDEGNRKVLVDGNHNHSVDDLDEDPDPTFDDTTPLEPLQRLIEYYQSLLARNELDNDHPEEREALQRRLVKHAKEWNQAYSPPVKLQPMVLELAGILGRQSHDPEKAEESAQLLHENFPVPGVALADPCRRSSSSFDTPTKQDQASFYYSLARLRLAQYQNTGDENLLELAEKWAKRCFKLRLEFRDSLESDFLKSVRWLIKILDLQPNVVEAKVYHDLYLNGPSAPAPASPVSLSQPSDVTLNETARLIPSPSQPPWWDINGRDSNGITPLISAVEQRNPVEVDRLISHGADVEAKDRDDMSPLLYAVVKNDEDMILKLKQHGAKLDTLCAGKTAIHHAIGISSHQVVKLLLELGAGMEVPDSNGLTPLFRAVLGSKADNGPAAADARRTSIASTSNGDSKVPIEDQVAVVRALCDRKPDEALPRPNLNYHDERGWTVLHHALRQSNYEVMEVLLRNSADPDSKCADGRAPLHYAIDWKRDACFVELLLAHGADVELQDKHGRTPLLVAVRSTNVYALIRVLLEHGARVEWGRIPDRKRLNRDVRGLLEEFEKSGRDSGDSGSMESMERRSMFGLPMMRSRS